MTMGSNSSDYPPRTHKDYYQALYQAALTFSSSLKLEEVLQSIAKSTTEAMEVKACGLRLLDERTNQLQLGAVYGLSKDYLAKGPIDVKRSPIDTEVLCGTPVFVPDVSVDTRFQYREEAKREGIVSVLCLPLEAHGKAIGVIRVYTDVLQTFNEEDTQFLSVLGSLAALAIENARLYESLSTSYDGVMDALWGMSVSSIG